MGDQPLTLGNLLEIITLVGSVGALWWRISNMLSEQRKEAAEAAAKLREEMAEERNRLLENLDSRLNRMEDQFTRKEVHDADMRAIHKVLDSHSGIIQAVASRRVREAEELKQ